MNVCQWSRKINILFSCSLKISLVPPEFWCSENAKTGQKEPKHFTVLLALLGSCARKASDAVLRGFLAGPIPKSAFGLLVKGMSTTISKFCSKCDKYIIQSIFEVPGTKTAHSSNWIHEGNKKVLAHLCLPTDHATSSSGVWSLPGMAPHTCPIQCCALYLRVRENQWKWFLLKWCSTGRGFVGGDLYKAFLNFEWEKKNWGAVWWDTSGKTTPFSINTHRRKRSR